MKGICPSPRTFIAVSHIRINRLKKATTKTGLTDPVIGNAKTERSGRMTVNRDNFGRQYSATATTKSKPRIIVVSFKTPVLFGIDRAASYVNNSSDVDCRTGE